MSGAGSRRRCRRKAQPDHTGTDLPLAAAQERNDALQGSSSHCYTFYAGRSVSHYSHDVGNRAQHIAGDSDVRAQHRGETSECFSYYQLVATPMSQSVKLRLERMAKSQLDVSDDSRLSGKCRKKVLLGCSAPPGGPPSVARRRRTPAAHRPARAGHLGFALFGHPAPTEPWGWQLWGHHLDVLCFILGRQMVLTPIFMGAEPSAADRG